MTHTSHVRVGDQWVDITHRETPGDFAIIDEVLLGNAYQLDAGKIAGKAVVDAGAHIGTFSCLAMALGARTVVAYEPDAENCALAHVNIERARQKFQAEVGLIQAAVGDPATMSDYVSTEGEGEHVQVHEGGDVPCLSFAEAISFDVEFLKCDVEGAEYAWFSTATEADLARVDRIALEWHHPKIAPHLAPAGFGIGELVTKLLGTHSPALFGRPDDGGLLHAHRY